MPKHEDHDEALAQAVREASVKHALTALSVGGVGPIDVVNVVRAADTIAKFITAGTVPVDPRAPGVAQ